MVKHIILGQAKRSAERVRLLWTLNTELSAEEKVSVQRGIKEGLEGLVGKVRPYTVQRTCIDFEV